MLPLVQGKETNAGACIPGDQRPMATLLSLHYMTSQIQYMKHLSLSKSSTEWLRTHYFCLPPDGDLILST